MRRETFRFALGLTGIILGVGASNFASAEGLGWNRFRGPNGSGISNDASPPPTSWSATENVAWKVDLPGPGSSSPIIVGDRVFVTCWSGYGTPESGSAGLESLKRHLICVDRKDGKILWDQSISAVLPEDVYEGMFAEHGYASHTPTSDGSMVYAFFGKSGVIAFDMEGKEVWRQAVGEGLDNRNWGSSSSPVLYNDLLIVTASAEKRALFALDKMTGKIVWEQQADGFQSTWGTPILVKVDDSRTDLVLGVPYELWGFDPTNGKLRWFFPNLSTDSFCSSVVADDSAIYAIEGRSGGSIALKLGGTDDVSKSHVLWSGQDRGRISTPVVYQGKLFFFSGGIANCLDAKTGKEIYQARLRRSSESESTPPAIDNQNREAPNYGGKGRGGPGGQGGPGGGGGGRRGGGPGGGQDYASPIVAGGVIYQQSRGGDVFVVQPGDEFKQIAVNRVSDDQGEDFSATPAAQDGRLYIRSSKRLYCIGTN